MRDPRRDAERWVHQAEVDLEAARTLAGGFPALACFHAQQSAEKSLKAVLYLRGERLVLGHSLADLGRRVSEGDPSYEAIHGEVAKLDRYYVPTRYPNGLPEGGDPSESFDVGDAEGAIGTAERALYYARAQLAAG